VLPAGFQAPCVVISAPPTAARPERTGAVVATGAAKWGDSKDYPWTTGFQPDYRTEAQIYGKYILKEKPNAKVAVLYQNDDFGKDYLNGLHATFGDRYGKMVTEATYEPTDPTIDSQITSLQGSGADVLVVAAAVSCAVRVRLMAFGVCGVVLGRAGAAGQQNGKQRR